LSVCQKPNAIFQVNFLNFLIAMVLTVAVTAASFSDRSRQRARERASRQLSHKAAAADTGVPGFSASSERPLQQQLQQQQASDTRAGVEFVVHDLTVTAERLEQNDDGNFNILRFSVLQQTCLHVPPGTLSCILGPTGCGKSVLLNMLRTGGQGASSGAVQTWVCDADGRRSHVGHDYDELKYRVGLVPQDEILDRGLTVRELLTYNARARRRSAAPSPRTVHADSRPLQDQPGGADLAVETIVDRVLSDLSIRHIADTVIGGDVETQAAANVSGGQLKRVNIACELVALSTPAALLLDEPTSGLDASIAQVRPSPLYDPYLGRYLPFI
jgi:ATPase subunit of ABC transporter with duplicated ATPase domains